MLTNIKFECNAPLFGRFDYFDKKFFTSLSKMSFNTAYSCHTLINIKHE